MGERMTRLKQFGEVEFPVSREDLAKIAVQAGLTAADGRRVHTIAYRRLRKLKYQLARKSKPIYVYLYCPKGFCGGDACERINEHLIDESSMQWVPDHPSQGPVMSAVLAQFRRSEAAKRGWETRRSVKARRSIAAKRGWKKRRRAA